MGFEQALKKGDLDVARAILDELVDLPDTGGLWMPECYADLAREYDRQRRHDDAIALLERERIGSQGRPVRAERSEPRSGALDGRAAEASPRRLTPGPRRERGSARPGALRDRSG